MRLFLAIFAGFIVLLTGAGLWTWGWLWVVGRSLPDAAQLASYEPPITSRVHAGDGTLVAEFARQNRVYVPIEAVPDHLVGAFLSAEDKKFFTHKGLDPPGIARAAFRVAYNRLRGRGGLQGGSTITQQVAKNMLLSSERTLMRKIKEALIALRIERILTKEEILGLYMNEIYLGGSSYGVGAASLNYFGKSLDDLTLSESALLAALPKSPGSVNPYVRPDAARARRNWVLDRMVANGYISVQQARSAQAEPLATIKRLQREEIRASRYFVEEVRRSILKMFDTPEQGEKSFYEGGLSVRSTLDTRMQVTGRRALREGLEAYDRRRGWNGPVARLETFEPRNWKKALVDLELPDEGFARGWKAAVVISADTAGKVELGLRDGRVFSLDDEDQKWIRDSIKKHNRRDEAGGKPVPLMRGDVVFVSAPESSEADLKKDTPGQATTISGVETVFRLRQIPQIEGTLVAMDPHTGRVLAMVGGYAFERSQFNRATQALRQPGSAFKPFVYAAALDNGFTPVSKILDAPFVIDTPQGLYKPSNYSDRFYGLSTLRLGLEKSRNLMTVRLAQEIGTEVISDYGRRFGLYDRGNAFLSTALGAGETTPLRLAAAYAMLVNGGKSITPTLLDRIQDRHGNTVVRRDTRRCPECDLQWAGQAPPSLNDQRDQIIDPITAYQIVSMMEGVIIRGTAARTVGKIGRPVAGKTGTTNDFYDAWFVGFSPDLVVCIWVGFDSPRSLGVGESGGRVAAPIFKKFMIEALENDPGAPFRIPPGVRLVQIDGVSGHLPTASTRLKILEAFRPGTEPDSSTQVGDSDGQVDQDWLTLLRDGSDSFVPSDDEQSSPEDIPEAISPEVPDQRGGLILPSTGDQRSGGIQPARQSRFRPDSRKPRRGLQQRPVRSKPSEGTLEDGIY